MESEVFSNWTVYTVYLLHKDSIPQAEAGRRVCQHWQRVDSVHDDPCFLAETEGGRGRDGVYVVLTHLGRTMWKTLAAVRCEQAAIHLLSVLIDDELIRGCCCC